MIGRTSKVMRRGVLVVDDKLARPETTGGRAVRELACELGNRELEVVEAVTYPDGEAVVVSDATLDCIFLSWNLGGNDAESHAKAVALLRTIRRRNATIPVFLMADQEVRRTITIEVMQLADESVWMLEDTATLIAGRAVAAIRRYVENLVPPFTKALARYNEVREYSWAAPGHQGGVAFTKSPVGRILFDFYGENLFRTDTGIERGFLGSLLDHSGPVKASEEYVARIFGAHRSYHVLVGTSASNRTIAAAVVGEAELALCDRNCHKSIEQSLILSGGIPVFFTPTRPGTPPPSPTRRPGRSTASSTRRTSCSRATRTAGCSTRAKTGTASRAFPTVTVCSTRSRPGSSAPGWATTGSSSRVASRRPWSAPISPRRASSPRGRPTS
jgi:arginine decarboxylase